MDKNNTLRVAIISTEPTPTHGWGRYTRELIIGLASVGAKITLITDTKASKSDLAELPLERYHRVLPGLTSPRRFLSLRLLAAMPAVTRLIAGHDVVHVIAEPYTLTLPPLQRSVVTAHGTYLPLTAKRRGVGWLYRMLYKRAKIICVSRYTEQAVKAAWPDLDTIVIPNGVMFERYQAAGIPQTKRGPTVLSVGQLKQRKGFHILAKAIGKVREVIPDVQAVFIGNTSDKGYVDKLNAQIAADGLTNTIHILGRVSDDVLFGWYHAADVFALPALNTGDQFEGFGLVYLEANAAGLPAIGTLNCGAEDAIIDGETGYLIPQNDPEILGQKLTELLTNSVLRLRMSEAGMEHARSHGWEEIARRVMTIYHSPNH